MAKSLIGERILRKEDRRFLTGRGKYVDDIRLDGETVARFVRSPLAHARIKSLDISAAEAVDGVIAVLTGKDVAADGIGPLPCGWMIHSTDGSEMKVPPHLLLSLDAVRYVGEPFALVIAETAEAADAGADAVIADFDPLPVVLLEGGSDADIHADVPGNRCYLWGIGDADAADAAIKDAAHVTRITLRNNRLIPNAIEPRAAIGAYDSGSGELTLYSTSQNPHLDRLIYAAFLQIAPEHKITVISPDVGGGFGSKIAVYAEDAAILWAARRVGRPVRWTADRSEAFLNDTHGRDHYTDVELALDGDGNFTALRVKTRANLGAYLSTFASAVPTYLYGTLMAGQYRTPAIYVEVEGLYTNTAPLDAYRGAGRPEATYVVERVVEQAARDLGVDPAELRKRNFIRPEDFPYETPVALTYDTGDYQAHLDRALQLADYGGFAARKKAAADKGRLRGIGLSCYIEACGVAPSQVAGALGAGVGLFESAQIRVDATGGVTVFTGVHSHGQSHETTFAQIVADRLGLEPDEVNIVHGDTSKVQHGLGTYGSRSLAVGGSAIHGAVEKVVEKGRRIAAHMLEEHLDSITFEHGVFAAKGTNKTITFKEVAFSAYVPMNYPLDELEPGLHETDYYDPANFTYPAGSYVCEVEIDPDTGSLAIEQFVAVDDFGRVINPMIVEGQVHGGLTQGIGQALLENAVYDDTGQLLTGSFTDYALPRADDVPNFALEMTETPCTHNPLGAKGCGEAGAIGSPAAFINAVTDALGADNIDMPATPERLWRAARAAKSAA